MALYKFIKIDFNKQSSKSAEEFDNLLGQLKILYKFGDRVEKLRTDLSTVNNAELFGTIKNLVSERQNLLELKIISLVAAEFKHQWLR